MRILIIALAVLGLAVLPCAWDSNPDDVPPVAAIIAVHAALPAPIGR